MHIYFSMQVAEAAKVGFAELEVQYKRQKYAIEAAETNLERAELADFIEQKPKPC